MLENRIKGDAIETFSKEIVQLRILLKKKDSKIKTANVGVPAS